MRTAIILTLTILSNLAYAQQAELRPRSTVDNTRGARLLGSIAQPPTLTDVTNAIANQTPQPVTTAFSAPNSGQGYICVYRASRADVFLSQFCPTGYGPIQLQIGGQQNEGNN